MIVTCGETRGSINRTTLLSVVLHTMVIALFWLQFDPFQPSMQKAPPAKISLGIRTASAGGVAQSASLPQQAINTKTDPIVESVEPLQPENVLQPEQPQNQQKPDIQSKPSVSQQKPRDTVKPAKQPETRVSKPQTTEQEVLKEVKQPEKKPVVQQVAQPKQIAQVNGAQGKNGSSDNKAVQQETGKSHQQLGDPDSALFDAALRQHLMKYKQYPPSLKLQRREGAVQVLFTIDHQGNLLSSKILSRKGHRDFEKAIDKLFQQAQPFPDPPPETPWLTREYRLTFTYELN